MGKLLLIEAAKQKIKKFEEIGRGGEAVIYRIKNDTAAKVFLEPSDPQFASDASQKKAAEERLLLMQEKLFKVPKLPPHVVGPNGVLVDKDEKVFGYTMPLIKNSKNLSEIKKGIQHNSTRKNILLRLYDILTALHKKQIVVGDLNENNILVSSHNFIKIVDVDSMQFGKYICTTFIPKFTAPELLDIDDNNIISLGKQRSAMSDWYGFLVIAMRLLTNTDPYGGTFPKIPLAQRIKRHITVFEKKVVYPANAVSLRSLPRPVLEVLFEAFYKKNRFIPERSIFA